MDELLIEIRGLYVQIAELRQLITDPGRLSDLASIIKDEAWITKKQAADLAHVSIRTIENRMTAGVYRYAKTGRQVRIRREDLTKFMELNEVDNYRKRRKR